MMNFQNSVRLMMNIGELMEVEGCWSGGEWWLEVEGGGYGG
jgi:hypothetical protein